MQVRLHIASSLVLVLAAACEGGDSPQATAAPTARATSTTTSTTAAGSVELLMTFEGSGCVNSGPDRFTLDDRVELTVVNESDDGFYVGLALIPEDRISELAPLVGTDFGYSAETFVQPAMYAKPGPRSQLSTSAWLVGSGTDVSDCGVMDGVAPIHNWWLTTIEVTR